VRLWQWQKIIFTVMAVCLILTGFVVTAAAETTAVTVEVPDFIVRSSEGYDLVSIPGGQILLAEEGRPQVPYWIWTREYPPGQHVRDVRLISRSDAEIIVGYTLPPVLLTDQPEIPAGLIPGWYPADSMQWTVRRNNDGSSLLAVYLYSLFYHPESKTIEFYQQHRLEIDVVQTEASFLSVASDQEYYLTGSPVVIDIHLKNDGERQDYFLSAKVRDTRDGEMIDGLPIMKLADLAGEASCSMIWQQAEAKAGDYQVEISLAAGDSTVIDVSFLTVIMRNADQLPSLSPAPPPTTAQSETSGQEAEKPAAPADWLKIGIIALIVIVVITLGFVLHRIVRRRG